MPNYTHKTLLESTTVGSILPDHQKLTWVTPTTTIKELSQLFQEKKILSVPVFDPSTETWEGFVDNFSLMTYIAFGRPQAVSEVSPTDFDDHPISPLRGIAQWTRKVPIAAATQNLLSVLDPLTWASHRLLITPTHPASDPLEKHSHLNILSQTDVVRFLNNNLEKLGPIVDVKIGELGMVDGFPITMPATETALEGFRTIRLMCISALAILNEKKELIGTLSSSDVRGLKSEDLPTVRKPVMEYLRGRHPEGKVCHPVTCSRETLLREVITQMFAAKVHRVWVVDSAGKVEGVVSGTDICSVFTRN